MRKLYTTVIILTCSVLTYNCHSHQQHVALSNKDIARVVQQMSAIMIHDVTNPPLAARFFAYTCLSGYEIVSENDKSIKNFHEVLNGYPAINKPKDLSGYDYRLSAIFAILETAAKLQPSGR